jgi:hypothetical protein
MTDVKLSLPGDHPNTVNALRTKRSEIVGNIEVPFLSLSRNLGKASRIEYCALERAGTETVCVLV